MDHLLIGKLYWKLLDFGKAQAVAEEGLALAEQESDFTRWVRLALFCLRLYKDTQQVEAFESILSKLKQEESRIEVRSGLNYILGIQATERRDFEEADRNFEIAEVSATLKDDEFNASYGRCVNVMLQDNWGLALQMFDQLEERLSDHHEPDIELAVQLSKARVLWQLRKMDLSDLAMEKARAIVKVHPSLAAQIQILTTEAFRFIDQNEISKARKNWETIEQFLPASAKGIYQTRLDFLKRQLHLAEEIPQMTLKSDGIRNLLCFGVKEIDVTSIPQLVRLLVFLAEQPGRVFSKEEICSFIWGESYHPLRHDNKIYVTIRRLRATVNEMSVPVVINREDGYLFNSQIRFRKESLSTAMISKRLATLEAL